MFIVPSNWKALFFAELKSLKRSIILLFENGQVWNVDTMMRIVISLKKSDDYKPINKLEFIHTEIYKDLGWTTYHNNADIMINGNSQSVK